MLHECDGIEVKDNCLLIIRTYLGPLCSSQMIGQWLCYCHIDRT